MKRIICCPICKNEDLLLFPSFTEGEKLFCPKCSKKIDMIYLSYNAYENGDISDGSHTFNELYHHRMILFSIICNQNSDKAWKSWKHEDGTMFDDYFIVGITIENVGDYSYHYHKDNWDYFKVRELEYAPKWDGHKPEDITRLFSL